MVRAAVLIGVRKSGTLPILNDAIGAAKRMEAWALAQQMARDRVILITDEAKPVTAQRIKTAVRALVEPGTLEQLIVYFSGHGVNIRRSEYWLLSDAPVDTQEAVNVDGSVLLARYCGIPHVVFVSDACRTAAEGIDAQSVVGSEIFPNQGTTGTEMSVDLFFASTLGKPAFEIKNKTESSAAYKAVYSTALLECLSGGDSEVLEVSGSPPNRVGTVRPRPLKKRLPGKVAERIRVAALSINQTPDARITSEPEAWLAQIPSPVVPGISPTSPAPTGLREAITPISPPPGGGRDATDLAAELSSDLEATFSSAMQRSVQSTVLSFGPMHFETHCGFKVRGRRIRAVFGRVKHDLRGGDVIGIELQEPRPTNVLIEFEDRFGVVIPAIPEFITALVFDEDELIDVSYEPSDNTPRWGGYQARREEIRALRSVLAASAEYGRFHLERADAPTLARQMQYEKTLDPSFAIYAAYAYHDLGLRSRIHEMSGYLADDPGVALFDVELLAGHLGPNAPPFSGRPVIPFFPLLSQGWALLSSFDVQLPAGLSDIHARLAPSLWTLFRPEGVEQVRRAMKEIG